MRSIDISKLFETANNSSSPCGQNPQWGDIGINPPGSLTTTTSTTQIPFLTECSVILNYGEILYAYEPQTNKFIVIGNFAPGGGDIAHTSSKLWFYNGTLIYEYDIQLLPFYATFNRTINATIPINNLYVGLHAISDTLLITSDTSTTPNRIVTLDISGSTAVETNTFDLPSGKYISGDIILTQQSKVLLTTDGGGNCFLYQYDYPSGVLEVALDLGDTMIYPYGLFEFNNQLFVISGPGIVSGIDLNYPHTLTEVNNAGLLITGASQSTSCITQSLVTPSTTTTTTTTEEPIAYIYNVELYLCGDCSLVGYGTINNPEFLTIGMYYFDPLTNFKIKIISFDSIIPFFEPRVILDSSQEALCSNVICF